MEAHYVWEQVHLTEDMSRSCGSCDCLTYWYFLISVFLFTLGMIVSVLSFGASDYLGAFASIGSGFMVGPVCICISIVIAIRNAVYLRRRRVIDMVIRQQIEDIRSQQSQLADARQQYSLPARTVSELTLPPPYEQLMVGREAEEGNSDSPPPSYDEAVMNVSSREEATATKSDVFVLDYSVK